MVDVRFWLKAMDGANSVESPGDAVRCKAVRSGARLIWDKNRHQPTPGEHDSRAPRCLPQLEQAYFFASHLAEVPERINRGPAPGQVTQFAHGAIW